MKIYISARPFVPGKSGGIVSYMENLVTAMAAIPGVELHTGHTYSNLNEIGRGWPSTVRRHPLHGLDTLIPAGAEAALIDRLAPDWVLYFYPFFQNYFPQNGRTRVATCIPDIQHVHLGTNFTEIERRDRDTQFKEAIECSTLIFTLSEFCRVDIATHYPQSAKKLFTVYPAAPHSWDQPPADAAAIRERLQLPTRFALYNANPWPHKNHDGLLAALRLLAVRGSEVPTIFTGSDHHGILTHKIETLGLTSSVRALGYLDGSDLQRLMVTADLLVFPSLFEGFGIPLLEAFGSGLPVASSNVCSLPEVGVDAAEYFDPRNPEDIVRSIELLWNDPELRSTYRARGLERYREFSYERSAASFIALLSHAILTPVDLPEIVVREPRLVSIVTPSYQQGRFLRACIESVLTQDYPHIEYLVFDGGSKDESVEVLKSYGDRFYWQSQPDGGQTKAINAGLARTKGSILAYLNSDDVLLPGAIAKVVETFGTYPSADLIYGDADYIDEAGNVTKPYLTHPFNKDLLKAQCYICQPAAFWTRRAWERYGTFDDTFDLAMDYEYWQRMLAGGAFIHHLPEKLAASRDYATTKTRGQRMKVYEDIFASQRKHWNHIHIDWWIGYVDYLANETPWWVRWRMPRSVKKQHELAAKLERENDKRLPGAAATTPREIRPQTKGLYKDGWLSAEFQAVVDYPRGRAIYLELQTPWIGEFTLTVNGEPAGSYQASGPSRFRFDVTLAPGQSTIQLTGPSAKVGETDPRIASSLLLAANWL